ncbi:oxidoreductase [Aspergillus steynii IBT 23096]|uniref:Oxidoreductase n=1 Tax=Aspergillus steynii IBT 23096 TaxID=1392250 RepID=A0A2I2G3N3_9EURO|nr:oxidoreductase [Aspergillus steynii IBT 23096]PLB47481.1 oxidoreductase [Aspergillus steynii IBT 23096]
MSLLNVAVVGYGFSAKIFHLPFIQHHPGFRLHAVVQRTPRSNDNPGTDFPGIRVYRDAYEAIEDEQVDALVVTSTNDTHFPLSRDALEKGKHVIVEKPFTVTYAEAVALADLAAKKSRQLAVYHNRRWDSDFLTLRSLLGSPHQPLGRIVRFQSNFDCSPNSEIGMGAKGWRLTAGVAGAGLLFDLGSHLLDQAVVLFGAPQSVTAVLLDEAGGKGVKEEGFMDDAFMIILQFQAGVTVELQATQHSVSDRHKRFEIRGTKGRWIKYGLDGQVEQLQTGIHPGNEDYGVEKPQNNGTLQVLQPESGVRTVQWEAERGGYDQFYQNVYEAIAGRAELAVQPKEAAFVMRLIELCRQSAEQGRTVGVDI